MDRAADTSRHMCRTFVACVVCFVVLILVVLVVKSVFGGDFGPSIASETKETKLHQLDQIGAYLSAILASVDQTVSLLTTVQLSLFVLVGFGLSKPLNGNPRPSKPQVLAGILFVILSFASLTLGYVARIQMVTLLELATADFGGVKSTMVNQAMFVTLSGAAAVCTIAIPLIE